MLDERFLKRAKKSFICSELIIMSKNQVWTKVIRPKHKFLSLNLKEVFRYKDLLLLFVRRDFVALYKQTILGPLWLILQPIFTSVVFSIIFGVIAKLSPGNMPPVLFYLSGIVAWTYFADCLVKVSNTFASNAGIFGKVYFPRLIMPLSSILTNLMKFGVQLIVFLILWAYFKFSVGVDISMNYPLLILPLILIWMAGFGLGLGLMITALTTKYRDLRFLIQFGIQLLMYLSSVVIAFDDLPAIGNIKQILWYNPLAHVIEAFRYGFLDKGSFTMEGALYTTGVMLVFLVIGVLSFNKVEKNFMDTV